MVIAVLVLTSLSLIGSGTLQERIDRASAAGGGRVVVPPGRHLVGQVDLRSNVELHLEKGAVLEGKVGLENYRVTTLPYSEGTWSAVVSAIGVTNVAVTGEGEVFGNGTAWPQPKDYGGNQEGLRPRGLFFADVKGDLTGTVLPGAGTLNSRTVAPGPAAAMACSTEPTIRSVLL